MKEINFTDILKAKEIGNSALNEASLGRAYQLYRKANARSFGIISAYRRDKERNENKERNKVLEQMIRSWKYGFVDLKGYGNERDEKGVWNQVVEWSFWVNGITKDQIKKAGNKFDQDAVIYAGPDTGGKVMIIDLKNGIENNIGKFHPMKIGEFYSKIKGKPFVFEYVAQGMGEFMLKMLWERKNKI